MTNEDDPDERVGQILLGKLHVIRRIGRGGMGEVYEVEHLLTHHRRALKIVRAELSRERRFIDRFLREVSIAGRLNTPFVAETFDAGWLEDDSAYVLMELLPGRSLFAVLEDEGALSERRACSLMCQVAEGMEVAHAAGIVHRDLKPENVFVAGEGDGRERVKILDFGVSKFLDVADEKATKLTREGSVVGTPYYMSPEQAAGRDIDGRSDVWSMGVMIYELLTGKLPFDGETLGEVMLKIGAGNYVPLEHRRPDLDPHIATIVARALCADLGVRYESAEALRRELLVFAGGEPAARAKTISDGASLGDAQGAGVAVPRAARMPTPTAGEGRAPGVRTPRSVPPIEVAAEVAAAAAAARNARMSPARGERAAAGVDARPESSTRTVIVLGVLATFVLAAGAGALIGRGPSDLATAAAASAAGAAGADAGLAPTSLVVLTGLHVAPLPRLEAPAAPDVETEPPTPPEAGAFESPEGPGGAALSPTVPPVVPPVVPPIVRRLPPTRAEAAGLETSPYDP